MKSQVGLWIDHQEAIIVTLIDQVEEIIRITSDVEELVSDAAPQVSQAAGSNKHRESQLGKYYGKIITVIHNAGSMLIFGPGEAKNEFQKKLERRGLSKYVVAVETTDNMTEAQIMAKVREHFVD